MHFLHSKFWKIQPNFKKPKKTKWFRQNLHVLFSRGIKICIIFTALLLSKIPLGFLNHFLPAHLKLDYWKLEVAYFFSNGLKYWEFAAQHRIPQWYSISQNGLLFVHWLPPERVTLRSLACRQNGLLFVHWLATGQCAL